MPEMRARMIFNICVRLQDGHQLKKVGATPSKIMHTTMGQGQKGDRTIRAHLYGWLMCVCGGSNVCVFALLKCLLNRRAKHFLSSAICVASPPEMINWHLLRLSARTLTGISGVHHPPSAISITIAVPIQLFGSGWVVIIVIVLFLLKHFRTECWCSLWNSRHIPSPHYVPRKDFAYF